MTVKEQCIELVKKVFKSRKIHGAELHHLSEYRGSEKYPIYFNSKMQEVIREYGLRVVSYKELREKADSILLLDYRPNFNTIKINLGNNTGPRIHGSRKFS